MANSRLEIKVGAFVLIALVLIGGLMVMFSKGVTRFARTYELRLVTSDVGGLSEGAAVLMAGYPIGDVSGMELTSEGHSVVVMLQIKREHEIRTNATFVIEQAGFLGDQFVAIYPSANRAAPLFNPGDTAYCLPPFNLQAVARDAAGFVQRIDETAQRLNAAIADIRRLVLNEETLTNLAATVGTFRTVSERALATVDDAQSLVESNREPLAAALSNLVAFTQEARELSANLDGLVDANAPAVSNAVKNIESSTAILESLLGELQAGKGLAGAMLKDEGIAEDLAAISHNLSVTTSNINQSGLWRVLWGPKKRATNEPWESDLRAPRDPFR